MARKALNRDAIESYKVNLRAAWEKADSVWLARSLDWYDEQAAVCVALGKKAGLDKKTTIGLAAMLSIDNSWQKNLVGLAVILDAVKAGSRIVPRNAHRYTFVVAKCQLVLDGLDPAWVADNNGKGSTAYKVKRFYANLMGDGSVVTIDRWHNRTCLNDFDKKIGVPSGRDYLEKEQATVEFAEELGISPDKVQAGLWGAQLQEQSVVA